MTGGNDAGDRPSASGSGDADEGGDGSPATPGSDGGKRRNPEALPGEESSPATRRLLDSVFEQMRADDPPDSLFGLLTPLYRDAAREDGGYDRWESTVRSNADDAESVLVLECGVGGLLARLADDYPTLTGVDRRPGLLGVARGRSGVPVAAGSPARPPVRRRVDAVVGLGHALTHVDCDPADLFRAVRPLVRPGGCVVFDAARHARTVLEPRWADEVAGYEASYAVTAGDERREVAHMGVEFELTEVESGESALVSQQLRFDTPEADTLREALASAGFDERRVTPLQTDEGGVLAVGRVPRR